MAGLDVPALTSALVESSESYRHFLPLLTNSTNSEDPIPLLTSSLLANLVSASLRATPKTSPKDEVALPKLYAYLSTLTKSADTGLQDIGVQGYSALLQTKRSREIFWKERKDTVEPLIGILRAAAGPTKDNGSSLGGSRAGETGISGGVGIQLLYHVLLVLWQLSFEGDLIGAQLES